MSTEQVMGSDVEMLPSEEDVAPPQSQRYARRIVAAAGLGLGFLAILATATDMGGGATRGVATEDVVVEDLMTTAMYSKSVEPPGTKFYDLAAKAPTWNPAHSLFGNNIKNTKTGLYVNVAGGVMKNENNVQSYNNPLSTDSQWDVLKVDNALEGELVLSPRKGPGFALNLAGGGQYDLTNVQIYNNPDSPDSHWQLFRVCIDAACTDQEINNKYLIKSKRGDLFLSVEGNTLEANVKVTNKITDDCQFMFEKPPEQGTFEPPTLGDCDYIIQTVQNDPSYYTQELVMNVAGNGQGQETNVQLYTNPTVTSSQWKMAKVKGALPGIDTKKYTLESKGAPGMYLNLAGGGAHGKTNVQLYSGATNPDNQWSLHKVMNKDQYVIQASDGSYLSAAGNVLESNVQVGSGLGMASRWRFVGVGTCALDPTRFEGPKVLTDERYKITAFDDDTKMLQPKQGGVTDGTNVQLGSQSFGWFLKKDEVTNEYIIRSGNVGDGYLSKCSTSPECTNVQLGSDSSLGKWLVYEDTQKSTANKKAYVLKSTQGWYYLSASSTVGDNVHVSVMLEGSSLWSITLF